MLDPSQATDQNAFFVTQDFADENNLTTLSDLAALDKPIKLAAPSDCKGRSDCEGGLTDVYGLNITEIIPLDFGSAQLKDSVTQRRGRSWVRPARPTAASTQQGLVILEDDKGIQPAQNLIPAVNSDFLKAQPGYRRRAQRAVADADHRRPGHDERSRSTLERQKPEDVAAQYLQSKGLA